MKKVYSLIIVLGCLLGSNNLLAQCSVTISTNTNTTQLNCINITITLKANAAGKGTITYLWNTGATTDSINVNNPGIYSVTITDTQKCTSSSSLNITKDITTPTVSILAFPDKICNGSSATLVGIGAVTYQWSPGSRNGATITVNPTQTTTYIATGTAPNGCFDTGIFKLVVNPLPVASITGNTSACQNATEPVITFKGSNGTKPYTFTYNINNGSTQTITTNGNDTSVTVGVSTGATGLFNYNLVSVTDANDCTQAQSGKASITILTAPVLTSSKTGSICDNTTFKYTATSSATGTNFSWTRPVVSGISNTAGSGTTATISETLHNTTAQPVLVKYIFTLSTGTGCVTTDTLNLTVNPTPVINAVTDTTFCNGAGVNGLSFGSTSPNPSFTWTCVPSIGFGSSGTGNIPSFVAINSGDEAIIAGVTVKITASSDNCPGPSRTFTIAVLPTPILTSAKTVSICDNTAFKYTPTSSAVNTSFKWTRPFVEGISNEAGSGNDGSIIETLHNITSQPIVVKYIFSLTTEESLGCNTTETLAVTVNPTPIIDPISDYTFCNSDLVSGIALRSVSPNASYAWTCDPGIGFGDSGNGSIPGFVATNTGSTSITATVRVYITASGDNCPGPDSTFMITVLPTPVLISPKTATICDNAPFSYTATSSAVNTSFKWTRPFVEGISNEAGSRNDGTINEILHNTTSQPIVVKYVFTLTTDESLGCNIVEILSVTVNPTPLMDPMADYTFCNSDLVSGIAFGSVSPNASYGWTCDPGIGFGNSGNESIPGFIATNTGSASITATVTVHITASSDNCPGPDSTFMITVLPTPVLVSPKTASICDNAPFSYTATSSAVNTSFKWTRPFVEGISNEAGSGNDGTIIETLHNTTSQPIVVKYIFTLSTGEGPGCKTTDALLLTVNPTPTTDLIADYTFCNGELVSGIDFRSSSPNPVFTWNCDTSIGFGKSGTVRIPGFNATNPGIAPIKATITVHITAPIGDNCTGPDRTFTITVDPSASTPYFTSLAPDNQSINLCNGSENINFNLNDAVHGTDYKWTSLTTDTDSVYIKDKNDANTVISFLKPGNYIISVQAINSANGGCSEIVSQRVEVESTEGIAERKIFKKQPGNLLIYPDNSVNEYQWGYDSIIKTSPDSTFGPSVRINGQVYQFFTPDKKFINGNGDLNESDYLYWVSLKNGNCYSKVYYNGPYVSDRIQVLPVSSVPQLKVTPNPNSGVFEIVLSGNIYGTIKAKIYSAVGQVVYMKNFDKYTQSVNEKFVTSNLSGGLYFIELNSSDLKKVVSRFLIHH